MEVRVGGGRMASHEVNNLAGALRVPPRRAVRRVLQDAGDEGERFAMSGRQVSRAERYFNREISSLKHVVMFSGGAGSWAAAKRVAERYGTADMTLLFANTKQEDEDLYRFLADGAANIGAPLTYIAEGRTPWEVMFDERMLGNSRFDPCSRILKREMFDRWLTANRDPAETVVYVGIDWTEEHRYIRLRDYRAKQGWSYEAPLCWEPPMDKGQAFAWMVREGVRRGRLYDEGFSHNNCGGFCIKAGQGHFANLLRVRPERYSFHENKEQDLRALIGKDVSILTDRSGDGKKKPLTLKDFRIRIEAGTQQVDAFEIGGCGCAIDVPEDIAA